MFSLTDADAFLNYLRDIVKGTPADVRQHASSLYGVEERESSDTSASPHQWHHPGPLTLGYGSAAINEIRDSAADVSLHSLPPPKADRRAETGEGPGDMHVHLPKPLHGWRAFAGEVGIIVIGVLIALGAQQVVETVNGNSQVREFRGAVDDELAYDLGSYKQRLLLTPCVRARLVSSIM